MRRFFHFAIVILWAKRLMTHTPWLLWIALHFWAFIFCVPWLQGSYKWYLIHTHLFLSTVPQALLQVPWGDIFCFTRKLKLMFCSYYWFTSKFSAYLLGLSLDFDLHFSCLMAFWFPLMQQEWPIGRISRDLLRGFFYVGPTFSDNGAAIFGALHIAIPHTQMQNIGYPDRAFPKSNDDLDDGYLPLRSGGT